MRKTQNPRNILYLVLSIVIAAGIWYYVDEFNGRVVTQTVTGIPIEYINQDALADNGLMLAEGEDSGTSTTIDITFKGNRRHIVPAGPLQDPGNGQSGQYHGVWRAKREGRAFLYGPEVQFRQYLGGGAEPLYGHGQYLRTEP